MPLGHPLNNWCQDCGCYLNLYPWEEHQCADVGVEKDQMPVLKCPHCKIPFSSLQWLRIHIDRIHPIERAVL